MHVLIAGGGLSGLALAHGLRRAGIGATVYEADPSPTFRPQGYRIHVDALGHAALAECLPEDLFELYVATSNQTPRKPVAMFFDHQFTDMGTRGTRAGEGHDPERAPTAINRLTLRQILLARLGDAVKWGHKVVSYEADGTGVRVRFEDGSTASGDVLAGAEGIHSVVREQLLPKAGIHDTGVRAITGKTLLSATDEGLPEQLYNSFSGIKGPEFRRMAMAVFQQRRPSAEAAAELAPDVAIDPVPDYLMWLLADRTEAYPIAEDKFWQSSAADLHRLSAEMIKDWHPGFVSLVERADEQSTFALSIRAILPIGEWPSSNVTILGDAIHAMSPVGGRGGNTALHDAALLARKLAAADSGEVGLLDAIAGYESGMREQGYAAVEESLRTSGPGLGARSPYAE